MPSNVKRYYPLIAGAAVALLTLTCSSGALSSTDPLFNAPVGQGGMQPTLTPTTGVISTPVLAVEVVQPVVATLRPTLQPLPPNAIPLIYTTQAGDTLPVLATRFGVQAEEITSPGTEPLPRGSLLAPNQLLFIPHRLENTTSSQRVLPDSELVFSPSAIDFNVDDYVTQAGGYLSTYREWLGSTQWTTGSDIIKRIALDNSVNPRILLALLEYQSGWVYGQPSNLAQVDYPLGEIDRDRRGLFKQLMWAVKQLSNGYYGWREGLLTEVSFSDGQTARLAPDLNAGTAAIQYYFAHIYNTNTWLGAMDPAQGFPGVYERMFGDPWMRAQSVEPLYPPGLVQPPMILPFITGQMWSFSGGPHGAWDQDGARAALDFAPGSVESGCVKSDAWVIAAAPGLIVRVGNGFLVLDLDGDGHEQTGWVLLYLHIATKGKAQLNSWVDIESVIGHPSCEGGFSTGTHIHIARKYNGEWIPADGPIPFNLSGWIAHAGARPYEGTLTKDDMTVIAVPNGSFETRIIRYPDDS